MELLRRSSLERRNGHLRRQLYRMQGEYLQQSAAGAGVQLAGESAPLPLPDAWGDETELEVGSPRKLQLRRLSYLSLELPRAGSGSMVGDLLGGC